jgi:hypothetical protein
VWCSLWGTDWILKYYSDKPRPQGLSKHKSSVYRTQVIKLLTDSCSPVYSNALHRFLTLFSVNDTEDTASPYERRLFKVHLLENVEDRPTNRAYIFTLGMATAMFAETLGNSQYSTLLVSFTRNASCQELSSKNLLHTVRLVSFCSLTSSLLCVQQCKASFSSFLILNVYRTIC